MVILASPFASAASSAHIRFVNSSGAVRAVMALAHESGAFWSEALEVARRLKPVDG